MLDVPRHSAYPEQSTYISAPSIVDITWEPQAQIIAEAHTIRADIGANHGKSPTQPRKELRCAVIPQLSDLERVPGDLAVDDLAGGGYGRAQDTAHGYEDDEADGLRPEDVARGGGVTREVGHVECERGFWSDGGGHALEEDNYGGGTVRDTCGF